MLPLRWVLLLVVVALLVLGSLLLFPNMMAAVLLLFLWVGAHASCPLNTNLNNRP